MGSSITFFSIRPEVFLFIYMASCISVLLFNVFYIIGDKLQRRNVNQYSRRMVPVIREQIVLMKEAQIAEGHIQWLKKQLVRLNRLRTFENSVKKVQEELGEKECGNYLNQLRPVFLHLASVYEKRDNIERAYFANLIEIFRIDQGISSFDSIIEFLINMTVQNDVYVRENALKALFMIGSKDAVLAAFERMGAQDVHHSIKLLADGLLRFCGDREELARLLFSHIKEFPQDLQLAVMQFIRFFSGGFRQEFLGVMKDGRVEKELRLEAIRYFRKYYYEPAGEEILKFLRYRELLGWEYAGQSALALANYPKEDVIFYLKEGLRSSNWYVRLNCAETLINGLKIPKVQLFDIYNSSDRYAIEILQYVSEKQDIERQDMKLEEVHV